MALPEASVSAFWAITCFLVILCLRLAVWLPQRGQAQRAAITRAALLRDIQELRIAAARLNTPATFSQCARLQRQAATKEKELTDLEAASNASPGSVSGPTWQQKMQYWGTTLRVPVQGILVWWLWRQPLAHLPASIATPLAGSLAFPHGRAFSSFGFVAVIPWLLLCDRAATTVVQLAFPLAAAPAEKPKTFLGEGNHGLKME